MAATIGGIAAIVEEHESWLRRFLTMPHGVPSHDTFGRVLSLVDPAIVTLRMVDWIKTFRETCGEEIMAIDGKALRRSGSKQKGLKMLDTAGAWATENGLIRGFGGIQMNVMQSVVFISAASWSTYRATVFRPAAWSSARRMTAGESSTTSPVSRQRTGEARASSRALHPSFLVANHSVHRREIGGELFQN